MSTCHRVLTLSIILIAVVSSCTPSAGKPSVASPVAMAIPPTIVPPSPTIVTSSTAPAATPITMPSPAAVPAPSATAVDDSAKPAATGESPAFGVVPLATVPAKTASRQAGTHTPVIALDPGHGGPESGAADYGLAEKNVNLAIALKLAVLLRDAGYKVVLTRDSDRAVSPQFTGGGYPGAGLDLQARIDVVNEADADLFLSLHNNGSGDPDQSGTEVWYSKERSFGDRNEAFAKLVLAALVEHVHALGYPSVERGIKDDSNFRVFRGRAYNLYVLGPGDGPRSHTPTQMPGILGESLFISNASDAAMLRQERTLDAIAAGYRDAIVAYFQRFPE